MDRSPNHLIDLYSSSSNLGDNLGLTPLCAATACRVHLYDDAGCRGIAPIFAGLAEVVFDNGFPDGPGPVSNDPTHILAPTTMRHLVHYGLGEVPLPAIPFMPLTVDETRRAAEFVSRYPNPCIIKCSPQVTDQRTPPLDLMARIVAANPLVTFLQFGLSKDHAKFNFADVTAPGIHLFYDLPIREQAAIYAAVGRYIGPDTGDYHLMLAVGGRADVLVPPDSPTYPYRFFHYNSGCWAGWNPRVRYHPWAAPLRDLITRLS